MGKEKRKLGGGGGPVDQFKSCDDVNIDGLLASQQPKAMAFVKEDDVVTVTLARAGDRDIVEVHLRGAFLGVLFANNLDKLIECLKKGHPFHGVVNELVGAKCQIWVRSGQPRP